MRIISFLLLVLLATTGEADESSATASADELQSEASNSTETGAETRPYRVEENELEIRIETPQLQAAVRKKGYVTGIYRQSFLDKKTGFREAGFGLDIVDWIMEPGSDRAYRDGLDPELVYHYDNAYHGARAKRSIEGPQMCTKAQEVSPRIIRGADFVAIVTEKRYTTAAPGKKTGSLWRQTIVFPHGKRYFISSDEIESVNSSPAMFLRVDMPGHIRHNRGDTFSQIYLSYLADDTDGLIPADAFLTDFAPDKRFDYQRHEGETPQRFIRAYRLRDPKSGADGPWLAGMTLQPDVVHEAWCHQRGYVCMIQEFGGRPVQSGESFRAAFVVGFFDSIDEMHAVYDRYRGHTGLRASEEGWQLQRSEP